MKSKSFLCLAVGFLAGAGAVAIEMAVLYRNTPPLMHWPEITNSQTLRIECAALLNLNGHESDSIPEAQWPQSVQALKPKYVVQARNGVFIFASERGKGSGWGYVVFPNHELVLSEHLIFRQIWGTGQEGIFKFQTSE